jgi:oligoribonuclease NrnB/cAMP/cGMP phosphodiesterase (DHH superfamily)
MSDHEIQFAGSPPDFLPELFQKTAELNNESERGCVLVCAAMLDDALAKLIAAFLLEDEASKRLLSSGGSSPLSTFSSRVSASFALGLVSQRERDDCEIIRKIRNDFAHDIMVKLSDQSRAARVANLKSTSTNIFGAPTNGTPRAAFTDTSIMLLLSIRMRIPLVESRRRKFDMETGFPPSGAKPPVRHG